MSGVARIVVCACAVFALNACDQQKAQQPTPVASQAPTAQDTALSATLRAQTGKRYGEFIAVSGMDRYTPENLGLADQAVERFYQDMQMQHRSTIVSENGVSALVFPGFAAHAGDSTLSILAISLDDGGVFIGVRDDEGAAVLKPNTRLQTLLTHASLWDGPAERTPPLQ